MKQQNKKSGTFFFAILVIAIAGLSILFFIGPEFSKEKVSLTENKKKPAAEKLLSPPSEQAVIDSAEDKLDKSAVRAQDIEAMRKEAQRKKGLEQDSMPQSKYIAPGTPPDVTAEEHPQKRLAAEQRGPLPQAKITPPPRIDSIATTKQTETLSTPITPESAPSPF